MALLLVIIVKKEYLGQRKKTTRIWGEECGEHIAREQKMYYYVLLDSWKR